MVSLGERRTWSVLVWLMAGAAAGAAADRAPAEVEALRTQAHDAFVRGDYEAMAEAYKPLAAGTLARFDAAANDYDQLFALLRTDLDHCLGLGHAHQLAGRWPAAVAAYHQALGLVEMALDTARVKRVPPEKLGSWRRSHAVRTITPWTLEVHGHRGLVEEHTALLLYIGRLERDVLKDPAAAADTFGRILRYTPAFERPVGELLAERIARTREALATREEVNRRTLGPNTCYVGSFQALRELARTQEQLGRLAAATELYTRANLLWPQYGVSTDVGNTDALGPLVQKLPPDGPLPRIPMLVILSRQAPDHTLRLDDPRTLADAYRFRSRTKTLQWSFALSPSPGREFASLAFNCDIEHVAPGLGGEVHCRALGEKGDPRCLELGSVRWPEGERPGRRIIAQKIAVPPGAGVVYLDVVQWRPRTNVRAVTVTATLRPRQEHAPQPKATIHCDAWPKGGRLLRDNVPVPIDRTATRVTPGHHVFEYIVGDGRGMRYEADLAPGARYAFFFDLETCVRWELTNLRRFREFPLSGSRIVRLPDGRWLVAYVGTDTKIMLSTSLDLRKWEEPWPLPLEAPFHSTEPALHVVRDGTLWLVYSSNRLWAGPRRSGLGYRLWLASSRDARTWSRPLPVTLKRGRRRPGQGPWRDLDGDGSWPRGMPWLLEGHDGQHWLFWRGLVGTAKSPDGIRQFERMQFAARPRAYPMNPHAAVDADGRLHLVFSHFQKEIYHATSDDGLHWTEPQPVFEHPWRGQVRRPQVVFHGKRVALIYEDSHSITYCAQGVLEPQPRFAQPIRLNNWMAPTNGARVHVTPDGQVLLLAGKDTVWLLRSYLARLTAPTKEF